MTAAVLARALTDGPRPRRISIWAYEVDEVMRKGLETTLRSCAGIAADCGLTVDWEIVECDFVLDTAALQPDGASPPRGSIDAVIMNPPYKKIHAGSGHRRASAALGVDTTNLYAAFVAASMAALRPGGHLVAITPRSFCNGTYFRPFREFLLHRAALRRLHVFASRSKTFRASAVLQETIITHLQVGEAQGEVIVTENDDPTADLDDSRRAFTAVVHQTDPERFIRIPSAGAELATADRMAAMPATIGDLGIAVSTGRVVDFRAKEHLLTSPDESAVPLLYPSHLRGGQLTWPLGWTDKAERIRHCAGTDGLMVASGDYVLVRRFTAKEERRRVAATWLRAEDLDTEVVGLENHLNYFHAAGRPLAPDLAAGLTAYLNSTLVDEFFRTFSGHTQVNAGDLKSLRYPTRAQLVRLGRTVGTVAEDSTAIDAALGQLEVALERSSPA